MKLHKNIAFFLLLLFVGFSSFSQTRKQLEAQRKKINKEIKQVNKLIFETKKKERSALEDLKDINQKISVRKKLINTINLEAKVLSNEISTNQKELAELNQKLADLKADYADMVFKSYKSKSQQSKTMFLLSSQNFYQAYKRLQYMNQYTSYRKKQGEEIVVQTEIVQKLNDSLRYQKQVKDTLILVEKEQKEKVEIDKKNQEQLVSKIKKKEKKYRKELQKKIKEEKRVAGKIDKIIRDAIAKSNRNRKKGTKKSAGFILTPEAKALAAKFEQNKTKLPWPVEKGLITRRFGVQKHPTIGGITINSTGIHLTTEKNAKAKSVFNGTVMAIQLASEGKRFVLVKHGNYITAYNNLAKVYVKKGSKITTGQNLGEIFTDKITGKTTLVFVLYQNTKKLNPISWLLKR
ncbi:murein hydrolase activator EnvC family protein [Tenacibaculum aquimarinum]|uniref:murein hydrolase activator EnvC family protein n=1 Tax=Tenacibaculum aquimarinum TaxID=2910675 RepID=UPI001F0A6852|nr:peptidoglycan DD-metalloendopeptidase family protein [Tenacibaculum aquimarinum]MCH3883768.1 peptidoglycan DD-metalloendopeptidase family protein [Tenacibaculum aquimarinum]